MAGQSRGVPGLPALYGRAVVQGLRAAVPLPQLPLRGQRRPPPTDDLTAAGVSVSGVSLSSGHLAEYRAVCGYAASDQAVPPAYPHVLVFPLHLLVMTAPTFPFPALGMIHIANSIRRERALSPMDSVDLSVHATDLRAHRRGRQVTLASEARMAGELVWREESVFLSRGDSGGTPVQPQAEQPEPGAPSEDIQVVEPEPWRLPGGLGRTYAAASGDRNPIHLFDLTARPFGFRRHIAHGMWTQARALAELATRLPERFRVDVEFKAPLALPSTVRFRARDEAKRIGFDVRATTTSASAPRRPPATYLVGSVTRL